MAEVSSNGKESEFNWAALFVRSLDDQVTRLCLLNLCLDYYDPFLKKYNYEIAAAIVKNMIMKLWGHLDKGEKEYSGKVIILLDNMINKLPLYNYGHSNALGGIKVRKTISSDNFNSIKNLLSSITFDISDWIENHKLGTPAKKDPTKAAVDL